ncbi:hypothetical protein DLL80_23860 [Salmonella enterica subsp. enterica serovar Newport]|uniref:DNA transfer protein n=1 Tax=Salmonella newport TaxID=108619 RepID=A0A5V6RMF8_SALNE|nr:hypothetical protein [Salmonella enterica subsp. enterica serovar Newport]
MDFNNYSMFDDSYNPTQSNVLGENLAPTAGYSDQLPALDFENDGRTAQDWKQQARQANIDADPNPDVDSDNYYVTAKGNKYQKVSNTKVDQVMEAVGAFLSTSQATGNDGAAAMAAGKAVYNLEGRAKRFNQIDKLEATNRYNDIDIAKWIETGDNADLTRNAGKWQNMGNGMEANTLTGETRMIPGYQQTPKLKQVNLGDRVAFVDAQGNEVKSMAKGVAPKEGDLNGGGSIGLDAIENEGGQGYQKDPTTGQWTKPKFNSKGQVVGYEVAGVKQTEQLNSQQTAAAPDANQQLVSNDLNTVNSASPDQIERFTGQLVGRSTTARDIASSLDPDTRKVYQASERLSGQLGNAAIAGAKAAGASGINTEAEIKRFTASVPQVDYTSPENYKASIQKIQEYAENFKQQLIRQKTGAAPAATQQPTAAPAKTGDYSHLW